MLNGDGNENGIKINRCNQQKNKFASAAHFFFLIIQKKNKFVRAAPFLFNQQKGKVARTARLFFAVVLHDSTTMPFCMTKTSNFLVNQTLFLWRNCLCLPQILFPVFMLSFNPSHFHLAGRHHFSFFHRLYEIFMFFLPKKFVALVFIHSLQLFLCYPHECTHQK